MDTVGPWGLLLIVLAIGLPFGATRLPKMVRSLGESIREFGSVLHDGSQPSNPGCGPGTRERQPARCAVAQFGA